MYLTQIDASEIDPLILEERGSKKVFISCTDCGTVRETGQYWSAVCDCGSHTWDMKVYSDLRDMGFTANTMAV